MGCARVQCGLVTRLVAQEATRVLQATDRTAPQHRHAAAGHCGLPGADSGLGAVAISPPKSTDFLKALAALDEKDRAEFCRRAGYSYDELSRLTRNQQVHLITRRYLLFAYVATLVAIVLLILGTRQVLQNAGEIEGQLRQIDQKLQIVLVEFERQNSRHKSGFVSPGGSQEAAAASAALTDASVELHGKLEQARDTLTLEKLPPVAQARLRFADATVRLAQYYSNVRRTGDKEAARPNLTELAGEFEHLHLAVAASSGTSLRPWSARSWPATPCGPSIVLRRRSGTTSGPRHGAAKGPAGIHFPLLPRPGSGAAIWNQGC